MTHLTPQEAAKLTKDTIVYLVKDHNDHKAGGAFVVRSTVELQGRVFVTAAPNIEGARPISLDHTYWSLSLPPGAAAEADESAVGDYQTDEGSVADLFRELAPDHPISQVFYETLVTNEEDGPYADGAVAALMAEARVMGQWEIGDVSRMLFLYCKNNDLEVPQIVLDVNKSLEETARKPKGVIPPGVAAADAVLKGRSTPSKSRAKAKPEPEPDFEVVEVKPEPKPKAAHEPKAPPESKAAPEPKASSESKIVPEPLLATAGNRVQIERPGGFVAINLAGAILQQLPYGQNSGAPLEHILDQAVAMVKAALAASR